MRRKLAIIMLIVAAAVPWKAYGFSLALDSVREWGAFPRFCVDVYRWGDRTFNSYDSAYVKGPGTKFNVKLKSDSWLNYYRFNLPNKHRMSLRSDPSTSMGAWITYLAVSAGYDRNVSGIFGGNDHTRNRWAFQFNCSLFGAELYWIDDKVGTHITKIGIDGHHHNLDKPFQGISSNMWGLETYYFFNHKRYSQAAAFNYSKIQQKSQGSFYAGISITGNTTHFNFNDLSEDYKALLPTYWVENGYRVRQHDYAFRLGYGYNWVVKPKLTIAISESPIIGLRHGYTTPTTPTPEGDKVRSSFALTNRARASIVFNSGSWFAGVVGNMDLFLIRDKEASLISSDLSAEFSVGYRFNLW